MSRHAQPAPLCAQPAHGPTRLYVSLSLLSDECPPTCSTGSLAGYVSNVAITSVTNTFSVTFCGSLVGCKKKSQSNLGRGRVAAMLYGNMHGFREKHKAIMHLFIDLFIYFMHLVY